MLGRGSIADYHPGGKFLILLGLFLFNSTLFVVFGAQLAQMIFPINGELTDLINATDLTAVDPVLQNNLRLTHLFSALGAFLFTAIIFAHLASANTYRFLKIKRGVDPVLVFLLLILGFAIIPVVGQVQIWTEMVGFSEKVLELHENAVKSVMILGAGTSPVDLILGIILMAIIPAIGEEFLFRGALLPVIYNWIRNKHIAVWVSALIFAALHFQVLNFPSMILLGAYLGYLFLWFGNIWLPVLAHFINNMISMMALFIANRNGEGLDAMEPEVFEWYYPVIGMVITTVFLFLFYRKSGSNERLGQSI